MAFCSEVLAVSAFCPVFLSCGLLSAYRASEALADTNVTRPMPKLWLGSYTKIIIIIIIYLLEKNQKTFQQAEAQWKNMYLHVSDGQGADISFTVFL